MVSVPACVCMYVCNWCCASFNCGSAIIANEQGAGLDLSVLIVNQSICCTAFRKKQGKVGDRCPHYLYSIYFKYYHLLVVSLHWIFDFLKCVTICCFSYFFSQYRGLHLFY